MGEASGPGEQDFQDYLLRELMSEGILRYPVPQKVGNDIVTVTIVKHGPVTFLVTTTRASLNAGKRNAHVVDGNRRLGSADRGRHGEDRRTRGRGQR